MEEKVKFFATQYAVDVSSELVRGYFISKPSNIGENL